MREIDLPHKLDCILHLYLTEVSRLIFLRLGLDQEEYMPPRLAHKKSRTGCQRCKARKVKCDETYPVCGKCHRQGVECVYLNSSLGSSGATSTKISSATPQPSSSSQALYPDDRLLELRLFYHYQNVGHTMSAGGTDSIIDTIWSQRVPLMALEHPFLLHAVLSIAALHLITTSSITLTSPTGNAYERMPPYAITQSEVPDYSRVHQFYLNLALEGQRKVLADMRSENADAACITTLIIANQIFRVDECPIHEPYRPPLQWLKLASQTKRVLQVALPLMKGDGLTGTIVQRSEQMYPGKTTEYAPNRQHFINLMDWDAFPEPDFNLETQLAYEKTLNYIGSVYIAIKNGEPSGVLSRRFFAFGPMLEKRYLELLEQRRPRALVMLAHLFAMSKVIDDIWLFNGAAERHVYGVQTILPPSWQWAMEWPLNVITSPNQTQLLATHSRMRF